MAKAKKARKANKHHAKIKAKKKKMMSKQPGRKKK